MPFGDYKNHADCVKKNPGKKDPDAFCAWLKNKVEGEDPVFMQYLKQPGAWYPLYRLELLSSTLLGMELMDREKTAELLKGKNVWESDEDAVVLDDHRWMHMWATTLSRGNKLFINKKELLEIHTLVARHVRPDRCQPDAHRELHGGAAHTDPTTQGIHHCSRPGRQHVVTA